MALAARLRQWLFQTGRDDPIPAVLDQRRIFILPSRAGLLFGLVLCVMYAGAVNYNLGLGHALVFLLASLGLTGLVHTFRNLYGLRILPGRVQPVFAGEVARFVIRIENDRDEARMGVRIRRGKQGQEVATDLPANATTTVEIPVESSGRGWLTLGRLTLSSVYPLGIFHAWSYPQPPMRCLVFPHPLPHPPPPPIPGHRPGYSGRSIGDEDFAGLRIRQPGDSPRHVAWKAFARDPDHRPLMVKQFSGGNEPEIWLDWALLPADMDIETRLSVLAGWVLGEETAGSRYGLRLPDREIGPGSGDIHTHACLSALALFGNVDDARPVA